MPGPDRRRFLQGFAALSLSPVPGWSAVGAPDFLAAALFPDNSFRLAGLTTTGEITFTLPLPARGHAAAAHPSQAVAIAFARRPGTIAVVVDCASGQETKRLIAPTDHHFYGHGQFSADGMLLFTTENHYEAGEGVIGVWDAANGYKRLGSFHSGGVGPHDMVLLPDGETLAIANGGIETHPDTGRTKLNLPTMVPNLTYCSLSGSLLEQIELPGDLRKNSIRHLATRSDGLLAFAMQWQGDTGQHPPLLGLHQRGENPRLLSAPSLSQARMLGYAGSVAFSPDGSLVAITSPRGSTLHRYDTRTGNFVDEFSLPDVCGLGNGPSSMVFTTGTGQIGRMLPSGTRTVSHHQCQWDNHLVPVGFHN